MEFAEVREYAPGDDVRTIDWNVTARTGAPHVKKFVEERDLTLLLLVDVSGSQSFGSQFLLKRDYAAELAAVLAFAGRGQPRPRGRVLFSDRVEAFVPPDAAATTRCASCATCWRSSRAGVAPISPSPCASRGAS